MDRRLGRHVEDCNNARLPGNRRPLLLSGQAIGWVAPDTAALLEPCGLCDGVLDGPAALTACGRMLADRGATTWRDEAFDVRATPDGPVLGTVDRGALPALGIMAVGVHLNGVVRQPDGLWMWIARRAANKKLDPGKLDQLVGGGVPAGLDPAATLEKEAAEEAGLPPALVRTARHVGVIGYAMERPEGLRRDRLHCYDLELPPDFAPVAVDGEVAGFELWPVAEVLAAVRNGDAFKFNVNLVLIDFFLRHRLVDDPALAAVLRASAA